MNAKMTTCGGLLNSVRSKWSRCFKWHETLVFFTFGLVFSKGLMTYVLQNLMTFFTDFWNLKLKEAIIIVNFQEGVRNMLQIYVALCIDAFLGYRWMLILSTLLYSVGLFLLAFSVPEYFFNGDHTCPQKDCLKKLRHTPFWPGLALLIIGGAAQVIPLHSLSFEQTKVLKPPKDCLPTRAKFGCLRFTVKLGGGRQLLQKVIRCFCFTFFLVGTIVSFYGFIKSKQQWHKHFLAPAIAMVIGLLWFLCGFPFYGHRLLQSSPLKTMLRTAYAAFQKRHLNYQENLLHRSDDDDRNQLPTDHLKLLNNAAMKESPIDDNLPARNKCTWRLCTVEEVEQTKLLLDIIPMSATFLVYGMVKSLGNTFFIEQASSMTGGLPIVGLQFIQRFSKNAVNSGYKMVFSKRIKRTKRHYSDGVKIGLGMLASITCCAVASYVEPKRLKVLRGNGLLNDPKATAPISKYWLLPQFFFLGAMEGLAGDGIVDFFGHYALDSRRYGPVFTSTLTGFGIILNIGFIAVLDSCSGWLGHEKQRWFGDSINQSRLDLIYRAYTIVALLNCFVYAYVASSYSYDNIIGTPEEEEEIPFLEVKDEETAAGDPPQVSYTQIAVR